MNYGRSKLRMNAEGDRLSILPDDLIHKILSFIGIKFAIQTSVLSSRWRFIWTSMPYLNISTQDFHDLRKFLKNLRRRHNNQIEVYSAKLSFHGTVSKALLKRVVDYVFSRNVQQLTVTCSLDEKIGFPLCLFRSQSLKHLSLTGSDRDVYSFVLTTTWDLPALTTLDLDHVTFSDDNDINISLFSKCTNLKDLTVTKFAVIGSKTFTVCQHGLRNLTLDDGHWRLNDINVVAPQLENLTIRSSFANHKITAPSLVSLRLRSSHLLQFSTDLPSLEMVDLHIYSTHKWSGSRIVGLLQQIRNVKFLTLNLELIEAFSSYVKRVSLQPSPFCNLKSLKIYPVFIPSDDEAHKKVNMSSEVISYLLDGSPTATFTMITYKEIKEKHQKARALANAVAAQNSMSNLQVLLEKEKVQLRSKRKMTQIKNSRNDTGPQIDQGITKTSYIISLLRDIESLLLKDLPTSKRDKLQARFFSLRREVDTFVKKVLHHYQNPANPVELTYFSKLKGSNFTYTSE